MEIDLSDAVAAARLLIGKKLVHDSLEGRTAGYIVETEAYTMDDPASHTFCGKTPRNAPMFGPAGTIYVYFTYGMHYCMNIVCGPEGYGQAVLIRALQPVEGIRLMQKRRSVSDPLRLTNGPGKLTQAMGIHSKHNNTNISSGPIRLEKGISTSKILSSARIGITRATELPWRFYIKDNAFVSKQASSRTIIQPE